MGIHKSYAVFGLGKYGLAVAKELIRSGAEVLAVDTDEQIVNTAAMEIPLCKCADVTDADVIQQLGINNIDVVIIAMGGNFEASVLATTLCKEAGVPRIIVKCSCDMHRKILTRVGADQVVIPEQESGVRMARNLLSSGFVDMVGIAQNISIVELEVKPEWVGKSLIELNLRRKYSLNVIAIRNEQNVSIDIDPSQLLTADMKLVVIAETSKLAKLN